MEKNTMDIPCKSKTIKIIVPWKLLITIPYKKVGLWKKNIRVIHQMFSFLKTGFFGNKGFPLQNKASGK